MDDAVLLQTRTHVQGDRDFLFDFLRAMSSAVREVEKNPTDDEAVDRLSGFIRAMGAFVEERNVQGETRRTPSDGV